MLKITIENSKTGTVLPLDNSGGIQCIQVDGIDPVKADISTSSLLNANGSRISQSRVDKRNVVIQAVIQGTESIDEKRQTLYEVCLPMDAVIIHIEDTTQQILYKIAGVVESVDIGYWSNLQTVQISIICPSPYFESETEKETKTAGSTKAFTFPFIITAEKPLTFGQHTDYITTAITYNGTVSTGAIFRVNALEKTTNIKIYNHSTDEFMGIKATLAKGEILEISTLTGNRYVKKISTKGVETNALKYWDLSSTWLQLTRGDNIFKMDSESGTAILSVQYTERFMGI